MQKEEDAGTKPNKNCGQPRETTTATWKSGAVTQPFT